MTNKTTNQGNHRSIQVLALLATSANAVRTALHQHDHYCLELCRADQHTRLPWQAERQPDLILLEPPSNEQDRLTAWLKELGKLAPAIPVLVIGELLSVEVVHALLRLKSTSVISAPFTQDALLGQISTALQKERPANTGAKCWSFMSTVGGAGATTLAIETAFQLHANNAPGGKVALIDLNFVDGACSSYLDAPANLRLGDVAADPERIDEALIDAFASPHPCGFDVLGAARNPFGYQEINAQVIGRLLDVCCGIYDHIVIDISRWMQDWTMDVIAGSDALVLVSELTVPALHAARDLAVNIEAAVPENTERLNLILNRMSKRVFGHSISIAEAQKALGRQAAGSISSDWDGAAEAVNFGLPIGQASPKSKISKDVRALIKTLKAKHTDVDMVQDQRRAC